MLVSTLLLLGFFLIAYRIAPKENKADAHRHGAGQIGLLAAVALFGVDYFTSYFYATGELMSALHPYGLQQYAYIAVVVIALANFVFGALYMYSLGVFNEGGGSYTASMRYLAPGLQPDRRGHPHPGLCADHRRVGPLGRRPAALDPQRVWGHLVLALCHRGIAGCGDLVPDHPRAGRVFPGRLHPAGGLFADDPDDGGRADRRPHPGGARCDRNRSPQDRHPGPGADAPADRLDERHGRPDRAGSHVERHPVRHRRGLRAGPVGQAAPARACRSCGISTAASRASAGWCRPPSCSTAA